MKTLTVEELNNDSIKQAIDELKEISWSHNLRSYASQQEIDELVKEHHVTFEGQTLWIFKPWDKADVNAWLIEHDMVRAGYQCKFIDAHTDLPRLCYDERILQQNSKEQIRWLRQEKEDFEEEGRQKIMYDR